MNISHESYMVDLLQAYEFLYFSRQVFIEFGMAFFETYIIPIPFNLEGEKKHC